MMPPVRSVCVPKLASLSDRDAFDHDGQRRSDAVRLAKWLKNLASLKKLRRLDMGTIRGYSDEALAALMRTLPNLRVVKRTYKPLGR